MLGLRVSPAVCGLICVRFTSIIDVIMGLFKPHNLLWFT